MKLEFEENPLQVGCSGVEILKNQRLILEEVNKHVEEYEHKAVRYISPIFLWKKTDGTERLILNLKNLSKYRE